MYIAFTLPCGVAGHPNYFRQWISFNIWQKKLGALLSFFMKTIESIQNCFPRISISKFRNLRLLKFIQTLWKVIYTVFQNFRVRQDVCLPARVEIRSSSGPVSYRQNSIIIWSSSRRQENIGHRIVTLYHLHHSIKHLTVASLGTSHIWIYPSITKLLLPFPNFQLKMSSSSASNPESVKALVAMGFPESQAIVALLRANDDINMAAELLSNGC